MYTYMYISQPFLLHLPPFHPIRLCSTTSPRKLASSCVVQTRVPRILLAGVGRCTRSLSLSLSYSLCPLHTHFALGLLFSHCSRYDISVPFAERALLLLTLPPPILNRVVSRTLGATFRPSLSKQDPLETETENSPLYLLFLALSLSFFLSLVELK